MNQPPKEEFYRDIISEYQDDKNVVGVMLFGSLTRNKFDEYSDVDIFILLSKKGEKSRANFIKNGIRVDIIFNTVKEARQYLKEEAFSVRRNTSHMLAYGNIVYQSDNTLQNLQDIAKENLTQKTKSSEGEILMHKYSIDDFWGETQRDLKNNDEIAFGLDSQLLLNNIIELFLKTHGEYFRQPNEMSAIFEKTDKDFYTKLKEFCLAKSMPEQKDILSSLVEYIYGRTGGCLPKRWEIK